jgi:hypothetical protein
VTKPETPTIETATTNIDTASKRGCSSDHRPAHCDVIFDGAVVSNIRRVQDVAVVANGGATGNPTVDHYGIANRVVIANSQSPFVGIAGPCCRMGSVAQFARRTKLGMCPNPIAITQNSVSQNDGVGPSGVVIAHHHNGVNHPCGVDSIHWDECCGIVHN